MSLSLITSNVGGQTKKMLVSACIWLGACVGKWVGKPPNIPDGAADIAVSQV